jgi:transcriptional regulator with XRE-family HTH domain
MTERAAKLALDRHHNAVATGRRVRWVRDAAGIPQLELATYVGCSPRTVGRVEAGERPLRPVERVAVARALGVGLGPLTVTSR